MATRVVALFTAGLAGNLDDTAQFAMADKNGATRRFTVAQVRTAIQTPARALDLLFVDATYDIGKSGATRPRDGFFSRNFTAGGIVTGRHFYSNAGNGVAALSPDSGTQSVANNGVLNLNDILPFQTRHRGLLVISVDDGPTAVFALGQDNTSVDAANAILGFQSTPSGVVFTANSPGNASTHNVYYDSGDDRFELENKSGATRQYRFGWLSLG